MGMCTLTIGASTTRCAILPSLRKCTSEPQMPIPDVHQHSTSTHMGSDEPVFCTATKTSSSKTALQHHQWIGARAVWVNPLTLVRHRPILEHRLIDLGHHKRGVIHLAFLGGRLCRGWWSVRGEMGMPNTAKAATAPRIPSYI